MIPNKKSEVIEQIENELRRELVTLTQAARFAHEAATHAESRSEDQHDTRGIEASYLAGAQAARAAEIERQLQIFQKIPRTPANPLSPISSGALIELRENLGKTSVRSLCLLSPAGGGIVIRLGDLKVQVITPQSPLGEALLGSRQGDDIEIETDPRVGTTKTYKILTVS